LSSSENGLPNLLANCKNEFSIRRSIKYYYYKNIKRKSQIYMSGFLRSLRSIFFYIKAEAAYFVPCNGNRTLITANIIKCHPKVLEPLFHELEATVEVHHPIMVLMILRRAFHYPDKE